jgi:hypothetical protein
MNSIIIKIITFIIIKIMIFIIAVIIVIIFIITFIIICIIDIIFSYINILFISLYDFSNVFKIFNFIISLFSNKTLLA